MKRCEHCETVRSAMRDIYQRLRHTRALAALQRLQARRQRSVAPPAPSVEYERFMRQRKG
jgi:hypothetical protein